MRSAGRELRVAVDGASASASAGALAFPEVVGPIYDEVNEIYGTDYEPVFK